jgi:subtilisin family serine protease
MEEIRLPDSMKHIGHFGGAGPTRHADLLGMVKLSPLMKRTSGVAEVVVGMIDGPVASEHPELNTEALRQISRGATRNCSELTSVACIHGTFVAGMLIGKRGSAAPSLCPQCTLLLRPIFAETSSMEDSVPSATPMELAQAIFDVVEAGARIINLSLALVRSAPGEAELRQALNLTAQKGIIVIAAAGNQGTLVSSVITGHPWVIPVAAYDLQARVLATSNLGGSIGRRGVGAPGEGVTSLHAAGGSLTMGGTSAATPFVTGAIALLWSYFPGLSAREIKLCVLRTPFRRNSIVPPLLDAESAFGILSSRIR